MKNNQLGAKSDTTPSSDLETDSFASSQAHTPRVSIFIHMDPASLLGTGTRSIFKSARTQESLYLEKMEKFPFL